MSFSPLPTAAQVGAARQVIADQLREVESVTEQIRQHEAHISALRSKIGKIHEAIAANEAYIAPVRRLPFEVLGEVVTLVATDPHAPAQVLRDLASICQTWRKATLRTPRAWTKVDIQVPSGRLFRLGDDDRDNHTRGPREKLRTLRDVQEWYDRSGCCKKDVSVCGGLNN
ncbi:hypothetical protein AURDEDRAFT_117184, partial [Auricularia subglabra TFB-10046 SS5]